LINAPLLRAVVAGFPLHLGGLHGLGHWARVLENGRKLAAVTGADPRVVELFAVLHDARRHSDAHDPNHGRRGAELATILRGKHFDLEDAAFALLAEACEGHAGGQVAGEATLLTCWDADRLDLRRCHIAPDPARLGTAAAREPELLSWADRRAAANFEPPLVREVWLPMLEDS
jgi:uncharacterized protein